MVQTFTRDINIDHEDYITTIVLNITAIVGGSLAHSISRVGFYASFIITHAGCDLHTIPAYTPIIRRDLS